MAILDDFFAAPSAEVLDKLTKDQLRQVCEHYQFDLGLPRSTKLAELKLAVQAELVVRDILPSPTSQIMEEVEQAEKSATLLMESSKISLTFEQQKMLIEMQQQEREAERREREAQREAERREREAERQLEMGKNKK